MPSALRALGLLGAVALLGGCNIVVSKTPVFTQADAAGAPQIRPGLWVGEKDDCKFDEAAPTGKWPDCAQPVVITPSEFRGVGDDQKGKSLPYVLAAGDPLVLQARADVDVSAGAQASASGGGSASASASATVSTDSNEPPPFVFLGVHPLALDRQGRIVRMEEWPVMCGPPPPEPKPDAPPKPGSYATLHPLPGLKLDGDICRPDGKAAVVNAARETRAYSEVQKSHWVRDSTP